MKEAVSAVLTASTEGFIWQHDTYYLEVMEKKRDYTARYTHTRARTHFYALTEAVFNVCSESTDCLFSPH